MRSERILAFLSLRGIPRKLKATRRLRRAVDRAFQFEPLEARVLLSTVNWTNGSGDNNWNTAANWSTSSVPGGTDDAVIPSGYSPITVSATTTVHSITASSSLSVAPNKMLEVLSNVSLIDNDGSGHPGMLLKGGTLQCSGNLTISAGTVDLEYDGPSGASGALLIMGGDTLTIASGATVKGGGTSAISTMFGSGSYVLDNKGTISATDSSAPLLVGGLSGSSTLNVLNEGTAQAVSGGDLVFGGETAFHGIGTFSNTGTLSASGTNSLVRLRGTWSAEGTLSSSSGGTINFEGLFSNSSGMSLTGSSGSYVLTDGTITGGAMTLASESLSVSSSTHNVLDGVTVNGNLDLTQTSAFVTVEDGLTLNGSATLGTNAQILSQMTETLSGTATISFSGSGSLRVTPGTSLTVASSVKIHGAGGAIGAGTGSGAATVINNGTVSADSGALTIESSNLTFTNQGDVGAVGIGTLSLQGTVVSGNSAALGGSESGMTWSGLTSGSGTTYTLSQSSDGGTTFTALPVAGSSSSPITLVDGLDKSSSYLFSAQATNGSGTVFYTSSSVTTTNAPDQSGWFQVSSPVTSYSASGYSWTLNPQWIHAGSPEGALAVLFQGLIPLPSGVPAVGTDGSYHLYHEYGTHLLLGTTFDFWSWTYVPLGLNDSGTIIDNKIGVTARSGPPQPGGDGAGGENPNALGGNPSAIGQSADPVRYFDGSVNYTATDLQCNGLGEPFGQTRSWTNLDQFSNGQNGVGWVNNDVPSMEQLAGGGQVAVVNSGTDTRLFNYDGTSYTAVSFVPDTLVHGTGEFIYTNPTTLAVVISP